MSLNLHVARDYDRVLGNTFGVLESRGKVLEFLGARQWEPRSRVKVRVEAYSKLVTM